MLFAYAAFENYEAASTLRDRVLQIDPSRRFLPFYTSCCLSIELSLKGYLRARGFSIREIKQAGGKSGHDLMALWAEATEANDRNFKVRGAAGTPPVLFAVDEIEFQAMVALSHYYKIHMFRYLEVGQMMLVPMDLALKLAKRIWDAVDPVCKTNNMIHSGMPTAVLKSRVDPFPLKPRDIV